MLRYGEGFCFQAPLPRVKVSISCRLCMSVTPPFKQFYRGVQVGAHFEGYACSEILSRKYELLLSGGEYSSVERPKGSIKICIEKAIAFREAGKSLQSLLVLLLTAKEYGYHPWIEDNFARLACISEDWIRGRAHWENVVKKSTDINATEAALEQIDELIKSRVCDRQEKIESFGHLLFEEARISNHQNGKESIDTYDYAQRFWKYDHSVDPYLTYELNQYVWEDCKGEDLRHAARYLLRNKIVNGTSFLTSIHRDQKLDHSAIKKRCSKYFDADFYVQNRPDLDPNTDLLEHFLCFGCDEGSKPTQEFSPNDYIRSVDTCGVNAFYHSICYESRLGGKFFELNQNTDDYEENASIAKLGLAKSLPILNSIDNNQHLAAKNFQRSNYFDSSKLWKIHNEPHDNRSLIIHFVIPDFSRGGGGHMTIFRMVRHLEGQGHRVSIWVINPARENHDADLREDVLKYFQPISAKVLPLDSSFHFASGDCIIATAWQTVDFVKNSAGFRDKFYFVQDYEPYFYARGTNSVLAEQTYYQDLACICASPWLDKVMKNKFGRWSRFLWLAYDHNIYKTSADKILLKFNTSGKNKTVHIAVYARSHTERRCVELSLEALEHLSKLNQNFVVHFFGDDNLNITPTYKAINHGVLDHEELAELYEYCDIGMSFSATNYSLLPQEMMAAGLPVFDLKVESTDAIYPDNVIHLMKPDSETIASSLNSYMLDNLYLKNQALQALDWVQQFSWDRAGNDFEKALFERLDTNNAEKISSSYDIEKVFTSISDDTEKTYKASIVIPTYNAGDILREVLEAISKQQTPWDFECLIIDSGSKDQTLKICEEFSRQINSISVYKIPKSEFQHGFTRNLGVDLSTSEFVAFLTQDAIPANENWLYNLVNSLDSTPNAAGAFGRHIAHEDADSFTKEELKNHFKGFDAFPVSMSLATDKQLVINDSQDWRKILHFYSDNNSCLRKSVWRELPLPCVPYGEDQLWADMIIRHGFEKLYVKDAVVKHSHNYNSIETFYRAKTESEFFASCFGYHFHSQIQSAYNNISVDLRNALIESRGLDCEPGEISCKLSNIYAKHLGWLNGILSMRPLRVT